MNTNLPPVVSAFFHAHNTGDTDAFGQLFTADAVVNDEAHEHRGPGIKTWMDGAVAKYKPVADVTDLAKVGEQTVATARVSGNFPGSPAQIRYRFTLKKGKIAALVIGT